MRLNVRESLRQKTAEQHQWIEGKMNLMRTDLSLDEYKTMLQKLYSFYTRIENCFQQFANSIDGLELEKRKKSSLLHRDLVELKVDSVENLSSPRLPIIDSKAAFLGCLYVLEGSTLGGQVLLKFFCEHLPIRSDRGGAFYNSYGVATGQMWQKFVKILEIEINSPEELNLAVCAAISTFQCLGEWMGGKENP